MKKAVYIAALAIAAVCTSCNDDRPLREFKVRFESNSDSSVADQTVKEGEKLIKPQDPTREGYIFAGWFKEASFDTKWEFDIDVVTSSMWLYAKWMTKLLKSVTNNNGGFEKLEYDHQDRLTKYSLSHNDAPVNPYQTDEFSYNTEGDVVKIERKRFDNLPGYEFTEEYFKSGNTITITRKENERPDVVSTLYLNSNGYPTKREELISYIEGATSILTYSYKDGNLTKTTYSRYHNTEGITIFLSDYEYVYDNMKLPYYSVQTPKWFMIFFFGANGGQNNKTNESYFIYESETTKRLERSTDYVYEYDSDGFPTKRTYTGVDGKTEYVNLFVYE